MVDFSSLSKPKSSGSAPTLVGLFNQLDRKATHESLRPVQIEALNTLDGQVEHRDIVLKVSTGSGKTVVGLVYAEAVRRRYPGEPVLYLCPTNQLIEQVAQSASAIGVAIETFPAEGHPYKALEGRSILLCTYDRLFNAKSTFVRQNIVPSGIVLDDVHSGVDRVRHAFTVTLPAATFDQIRQIFQPLCEGTDPAIWRGIVTDDVSARYEVPFWIWQQQADAVARLLEEQRNSPELMFRWANVSRYIHHARLCISGVAAELVLPVPPVEEHMPFSAAKRRLFMSASIKDGTGLLKDLSCDSNALTRIIEPPSDKGAGERMILPAALIDPTLTRAQMAALCASESKRANVVVLTSSTFKADAWVKAGATAKAGIQVDEEIAALRVTPKGRYTVFPQRFDGVDLPDDACRILVIDGTPTGDRICDQIDLIRQRNSPGFNARVVNRFEQALGRAVRSSADYAAILLVGTDIASFIGRRDVKDLFESHTREQIELGKDLAEQLKKDGRAPMEAIRYAIDALLRRDEQWKTAHRDRMEGVTKTARSAAGMTVGEHAALAEREAWELAKARNYQGATSTLQRLVDMPDLHPIQRAELLYRMASYANWFDPAAALAMYRSAFQINPQFPRPVQLPDRRYSKVRQQVVNVRDALQVFSSANAAISRLEEVRAKLAYAGGAEIVEQGLFELGEILGAEASRPEKETGRGPDVLWLFDEVVLCIEAKNEKHRPIFKSDAAQLILSTDWCRKYCDLGTSDLVSVFATNVPVADRTEDMSFGPRCLTEEDLSAIAERVRGLINGLAFHGPLFGDSAQLQEKLQEFGLRGRDLAQGLAAVRTPH
jgi:hypothetical protein